jgi:hypothetical protein
MNLVSCAGTKQLNSVDKSPEKLGRVGAEITKSPDSKPQILSNHDLTPEEFSKAIREIASDADLSRRYHDAFRKALNEEGDRSA